MNDILTARKYLYQARQLNGTLSVLQQQEEFLRTVAEKTVGVMTADKIQVSKNGKEGEDTILAMVKKQDEVCATLDSLKELRSEIVLNIIRYAPSQAEVLNDYYINGMTHEEIAVKHGKSKRQWSSKICTIGENNIQKAINKHPKEFTSYCFDKR